MGRVGKSSWPPGSFVLSYLFESKKSGGCQARIGRTNKRAGDLLPMLVWSLTFFPPFFTKPGHLRVRLTRISLPESHVESGGKRGKACVCPPYSIDFLQRVGFGVVRTFPRTQTNVLAAEGCVSPSYHSNPSKFILSTWSSCEYSATARRGSSAPVKCNEAPLFTRRCVSATQVRPHESSRVYQHNLVQQQWVP